MELGNAMVLHGKVMLSMRRMLCCVVKLRGYYISKVMLSIGEVM